MRSTIIGASLALLMTAAGAGAHDYELGSLRIYHPWARETAASQSNGAAYLTLNNSGEQPDRLLSARTPMAESTEIHSTTMNSQGVMQMRPVEAVDIPPGGEVALQPGGLHVMLLGLHEPLKEDASFPLTLVFDKAGEIEVEVEVESIRGGGVQHGEGAGHGGGMGHGAGMQHGQPKSD